MKRTSPGSNIAYTQLEKPARLPILKGTIPFYFVCPVGGTDASQQLFPTALKYKFTWQDCLYSTVALLYLSDCV